MGQLVVAPEREHTVMAREAPTDPGGDRRFEMTKHVVMACQVGTPVFGKQVIRVGRLIETINLMHLGQQASARVEAGLERELRRLVTRPAHKAALQSRAPPRSGIN